MPTATRPLRVLVPKTVAWSDPGRLVGVGSRWAPGTPVVDPLEPKERDQGQYDVDRPVYAGDSAGMLVRADVWQALDGMDPTIGDWAGPPTCAGGSWGTGGEVMVHPRGCAWPTVRRATVGCGPPPACPTPDARRAAGS